MHRLLRGELLMFGGFAVAATVTILLVLPTGTSAGSTQYTQLDSGPVGPADRDLLVRVRQAGLWEAPVGQWAQTRAESQVVQDVGKQLTADHTKLDVATRALAAKLKVPIPDTPNADQQSWMAQLSAEKGPAFDKDFANLLRAAHGKVFAVVADVRAGTRNDEIRKFANTANTIVLKHMTLLESTEMVDYGELPEPPTPSPVPPVASTAADTRRQ
jgi:predicted outer membrane protein